MRRELWIAAGVSILIHLALLPLVAQHIRARRPHRPAGEPELSVSLDEPVRRSPGSGAERELAGHMIGSEMAAESPKRTEPADPKEKDSGTRGHRAPKPAVSHAPIRRSGGAAPIPRPHFQRQSKQGGPPKGRLQPAPSSPENGRTAAAPEGPTQKSSSAARGRPLPVSRDEAEPRADFPHGAPVKRVRPRYERNPPPPYPEPARKRGYEGLVLLAVLVGSDGRVANVRLLKSSGHRILDQAALQAVRGWRFLPAMRGDEPVEMEVQIPIRFRIR